MLELNRRSALLLAFTLLPISWIGAQTADLISVRSLSQIQGLASNLGIPNGVLPLGLWGGQIPGDLPHGLPR